MKKPKILTFTAHDDDNIFGLGGTLIKHIEEGADATCVIKSPSRWCISVIRAPRFQLESSSLSCFLESLCVICCRLNSGCAVEPPDRKSQGFVV